jgi:arginine-tRNA-protein transferase
VEDTPISTGIVEFRAPDGTLLGACLTDWLNDGLSAVYSFYAPEMAGLGTLAILWLVEEAQRSGQPYVYLGYWVPQSRKMAYKAAFRPAEVLRGGVWQLLDTAVVPEMAELSAE